LARLSIRTDSWRESRIWKLGLLLGSINAIYYATNAFLPEYLSRLGRGDLIDGALTALNLVRRSTHGLTSSRASLPRQA
jgi:cyanate permease